MNKARLIKKDEIAQPKSAKSASKTTPVSNSVTAVKEWLNSYQKNTKPNARETFARLFAQPQENY